MGSTKRNSRTMILMYSMIFVVTLLNAKEVLVSANEATCDWDNGEEQHCKQATRTTTSLSKRPWTKAISQKFREFLRVKVFAPEHRNSKSLHQNEFLSMLGNDTERNKPQESSQEDNTFARLLDKFQLMAKMTGDTSNSDETFEQGSNDLIASLLRRVQELNQDDQKIVGLEFWDLMNKSFNHALEQITKTFGHITETLDSSILMSMLYFLVHEDSQKTPSWKRRQHRFYEKVDKTFVLQLHDALYLSQLAYVNTVNDFRKGLSAFQANQWELAFGTTESLPDLPAHFLLIHKNIGPLGTPEMESLFPWEERQRAELTVVLVVRGTKHLSDALADLILEPVEYRNGYAHGGILQNGKNLAAVYRPKLESLLRHSGRERLRLYLIGHSLGAGAASIAAMEFKDHPFFEVEALGFGCPSLLSPDISASVMGYVTTVIADADIIPRMSGSSITNFLLDLLEYDWTDVALEDISFTVDRARETLSLGRLLPSTEKILDWIDAQLSKEVKPRFRSERRERIPNALIPPGDCIHFYRDGVGYSAAHTPCNDFTSVEFTRTLIDDHLVMPGYHRAMVTLMRDWEADFNFDFEHDIAAIQT